MAAEEFDLFKEEQFKKSLVEKLSDLGINIIDEPEKFLAKVIEIFQEENRNKISLLYDTLGLLRDVIMDYSEECFNKGDNEMSEKALELDAFLSNLTTVASEKIQNLRIINPEFTSDNPPVNIE